MADRASALLICGLAIAGSMGDPVLAREQSEEPPVEAPAARPEAAPEETDEQDPDRDIGISERVTVTATRVETELMKTPVAVSVFDQETLDREGVKNVRDMATMVPNMDIATINGQSTPIISLRGVRSTNETELGDPSVGVHLDGIYSPRMQGILGLMFDNERVEVLRGPQGTLFGRNSTVGSINIISAKPRLDAFDSRLYLQYGNYNAPELQAVVNKPLSDTFAVRFAGRYHKRDSFIDGYWDPNQYDQRHLAGMIGTPPVIAPGSFDQCTSPQCRTRTQHSNWWAHEADGGYEIRSLVPADEDDFYMNAKEWAYRLSGLWQPRNKDVSLNLSFQHFRSDSAGGVDLVNCEKLRGRPNYVWDEDTESLVVDGTADCSDLFPSDDPYQAVVNTPGRFFLDIKYLRSQFTWDINEDLRFIYSLGVEDQDRESQQDMEQSLNAWDQAMSFLPGTGSASWMNEVQLQSYGAKKFNWIVGANIFHEKTKTIGFFDNAIGEKSFWFQPNRASDAWALFAQGTYSLTDRWHLTLGYRHSDETKEDRGGRTYTCIPDSDDNPANDCAPEHLHRAELNAMPANYFSNPSVYLDDSGNLNFSANDNKGSWSHNDWRIGIDYDRGANTLLYAYLATGFKAGGIGDVFHETNPRTQEEINVRTSFHPEEVTTLELGFKQRFPAKKLDLRGAYFFSDYKDMQYASVGSIAFTERWEALRDEAGQLVRDDNGNFVFGWVTAPIIAYFTQNVPGAEIQGFELEYDWRPWSGGRVHGYASWLDTEITEDWITRWSYDPVSYFGLSFEDSIDPTNPILMANLKGNELAVSPPFKLHMTLDHAFFLQRQRMTIVPWATAHWEDDSYLTVWNVDKHTDDMEFVIFDDDIRYTDDKRDAWSMFHAGVRFHHGDLTAELYGYNLTDEFVQYWGGAAEQVAKGSVSMPRTFGIRIGYDF